MAGLGRAALVLSLALVLYATLAGGYAAWRRRRRLALSAQNALLAAFLAELLHLMSCLAPARGQAAADVSSTDRCDVHTVRNAARSAPIP